MNKPIAMRGARVMNKQFGGTVLGFIIGGVVGLLAALIVAVYVTKVPVPFVNKAVNRSAEQDAAEAVKNKNWDPNAPLANKPQARAVEGVVAAASAVGSAMSTPTTPASSPVAVAHVAVPPPGMASAAVPAYVASKPSDKGNKGASDPLGDLVKAKAAAGAASTPSAASQKDADAFFVQAGAYTNADDAEAQKAKLLLNGLEAKVTEREVNGRTVYRVRVGPIDKKPDADKTRERLEGLGYDARVMTVSR